MQVRKVQVRVTLAGRYAFAFFGFAKDKKILPIISEQMQHLQVLVLSSRDFRLALKNRLAMNAAGMQIFEDVGKLCKFHVVLIDFLKLLVKNKRTALLLKVVENFQALLDDEQEIVPVKLDMEKYDSKMVDVLTSVLKKYLSHKNYRFDVKEDPDLIAGFRVFIQGQCFDFSLKTRLNNMRSRLKEA